MGSTAERTNRTGLSRREPAVAAIVRAWRELTSPRRASGRLGRGGRTLVACSGGADSCALVLALAAAEPSEVVVGHVVHDLRPRSECLGDRDTARELAERLDIEFVEADVRVLGAVDSCRNLESAARKARYQALAQMAVARGAGFVATAHHADDQLETVLMSLVRGTGAGGVRGMPVRRRLVSGVSLVRPMLLAGVEINRATCRRLCDEAGIRWSEDATNSDTSRLRAAIRHRVIPVLKDIRPSIANRAISAARQAEGVDELIRHVARGVLRHAERGKGTAALRWTRSYLRGVPPIVLGYVLRAARGEVVGTSGADKASKVVINAVVRCVQDSSTEPRTINLAGAEVRVTARSVVVGQRGSDER